MNICNGKRYKGKQNEQRWQRLRRLAAVASYMNHLFVAIEYSITWAINISKIMFMAQISIGNVQDGILIVRHVQSRIQVWLTVALSKMYTITVNYRLNFVDKFDCSAQVPVTSLNKSNLSFFRFGDRWGLLGMPLRSLPMHIFKRESSKNSLQPQNLASNTIYKFYVTYFIAIALCDWTHETPKFSLNLLVIRNLLQTKNSLTRLQFSLTLFSSLNGITRRSVPGLITDSGTYRF